MPALDAAVTNGPFGPLANHVELALECHVIGQPGVAPDESLLDKRLPCPRRRAQGGIVGRHNAPAQKLLPFLDHDVLEQGLASAALIGIARQENHRHPVIAQRRQLDFFVAGDLLEKSVRHLHEDARPIAGIGFATTSPAVVQIDEDGQGIANDFVRFFPLDIDHKPHPAGIVLELRVVQPLFQRPSIWTASIYHCLTHPILPSLCS